MTRLERSDTVFRPGRNCWQVEQARRFRCIEDGAECFRLVRDALLGARQTVFILGWDIAGGIDLLPGEEPGDGPTRLDALVRFIARRRPDLRCYILTWDYGALYAFERDPFSRLRLGWRTPRGVRFGYDDRHPIGACHHQKVIVVDDSLAFSGSLDLTGHRWDTSEHLVEHPHRVTAIGQPYGPYHEVQAMVDGPVAARLGYLARDRWRALGAERLPPVRSGASDLWPAAVTPDLTDVGVAIARTVPASSDRPAVRECEALFFDSIASARRMIYIENQYFTSARLAAALARRLAEPDGPEIVVVTPRDCTGWLETSTMGAFREAAFREMLAADAHGRLRLVCPVASRSAGVATFIHSKVMVVDDELLRIGSANCTNRSMGMDTECDLAVEAGGDRRVAAGIRGVLSRLIADHAGLDPSSVSDELASAGSLRAFIDAHLGGDRGLAAVTLSEASALPPDAIHTAVDPDEPLDLGPAVDALLPPVDARSARSPLSIWILPVMAIAAAAIVATASATGGERSGLEGVQAWLSAVPSTGPALAIGTAAFVAAALLFVPVDVLILAAGLVFGATYGPGVAVAGAAAAAGVGFGAGRVLGPTRVARWISRRAYRSAALLHGRGVVDIAVLRLSRVASASAVDLICGAGRVPFGTFAAGTLLAVAPTAVALAGLGGLLQRTVLAPSAWHGLLTISAALLILAAGAILRTLLLIRQFAPAAARHRRRSEFG